MALVLLTIRLYFSQSDRDRFFFLFASNMASQEHDDDIHEETPGYKLSQPKQSLAEYQQMGTSV